MAQNRLTKPKLELCAPEKLAMTKSIEFHLPITLKRGDGVRC
jgi:hypothetical protein